MIESHKRWSVGLHFVFFFVGAFVGALLPSDLIARVLGFIPVTLDAATSKLYWQYGREGFAARFMVFGTISFLIGALVAKRFWSEPAKWVSVILGVIYSMSVYFAVVYLPMPRGSFSGLVFLAWVFLFPLVAILLISAASRRSNYGVQPTRETSAADADR